MYILTLKRLSWKAVDYRRVQTETGMVIMKRNAGIDKEIAISERLQCGMVTEKMGVWI